MRRGREESKVNEERGSLVLLSGPSGAGKTSVCERLLRTPEVVRAITATTRSPRPGEVDGEHYFFLDDAAFREGIEGDRFLEWAEVHGRLYGTPREPLERQLDSGRTVLLSIDVQGAEALMDRGVSALYLFLEPPSIEELRRRLEARGSDDEATIELRMRNALAELARKDRYDHSVVNDDLDRAVAEILELIQQAEERT